MTYEAKASKFLKFTIVPTIQMEKSKNTEKIVSVVSQNLECMNRLFRNLISTFRILTLLEINCVILLYVKRLNAEVISFQI